MGYHKYFRWMLLLLPLYLILMYDQNLMRASHIFSVLTQVMQAMHDSETDSFSGWRLPATDDSRMMESFLQPMPVQMCDESSTELIIVDQSGLCSNFTTIQGAVNDVRDYNNQRVRILVLGGTYVEKVLIPITKPCIQLQGEGNLMTSIVWNDTAKYYGTRNSASVAIEAPNFIARNISFRNTAPAPQPGAVGAQAVALRISADEAAFYGCGIYGAQDTLYDDAGRHYFEECYIEGSIDFIFGNGRSLYQKCELHSIAKPRGQHRGRVTGAITAHGRRSASDNTGFSFVNCSITGTGGVYLGRAWGPFSLTLFAYTNMSDIIVPQGWNDWNDPSRDQTIYYGEYMCTGPGSDLSERVSYSRVLNSTEAAPFLDITYIDGQQWLLDQNTTASPLYLFGSI